MQFDLERRDHRSVSDGDIARYHDLVAVLLAERLPLDPPPGRRSASAALRDVPATQRRWSVAAVQGDVWLGAVVVIANEGDDRTVRLDIGVRPTHRRAGIGTALLVEALELARSNGYGHLISDTYDSVPAGERFAERIGATPGLVSHVNRLALGEVDSDLVDRWIAEGPERAPGYQLVAFDGRCPDDLVADVADILTVMNDAPTDDLDVEPFTVTKEMFRAYESIGLNAGTEVWWLLARHEDSGQIAGETDVRWYPRRPGTMDQGNTVVRREHRGHALGKWLKASMLRRVLDERPDVIDIRTSNAASNDAMVSINHQLGFRPLLGTTTWQVEVSAAVADIHR